MEPVNIDFMLGGNVEQEAPKIEKSIDGISNSGKKAVQSAREAVKEQEEVIKQIQNDMASIEKQLTKASPGNAKEQLIKELNSAKQALAEEKAALSDYSNKVDQAAASNVRLRTKVMEAKDALAKMEMAGMRGTPQYAAQAKVLGDLNDQMQDTNAQAKILADDQKGFKAVSGAVNILTGSMTAAVGIASAFGAKDEDLAKIQTRLQAVMAVTIGITQVANALDKDQYLNVVIITKAKEFFAAAELKVAAAMGVSTVAARVMMATLTLGLSVAITAVVVMFEKWSSKQDELKKKQEEMSKFQNELRKSISEGYAGEESKIQALRTALESENISRDKKLGIINQLKEQIPGYTAQLDAEGNVIRENKKAVDDYMISLEKSLKFRAAEKELATIYEKIYNIQRMQTEGKDNGSKIGDGKPLKKVGDNSNPYKFKSGTFDGAINQLQNEAKLIKDYISGEGLLELDKDKNKADKTQKEEFDATKAFQKEILHIHDQTSKLLLQQQEDSLQKRLSEIDLEKELEIQKIREKEVAIIDAYNKAHKGDKGFKSLSTKPEDILSSLSNIDPDQAKLMNDEELNLINAYGAKKVATTDKWTQELLELAIKYGDERTKIEEDYEKRINKLAQGGFIIQAAELANERDKKISAVSTSLIQETDLYKLATGKQLQISKELTAGLIAELEKRIEADQTITSEDADKMLAKLHQADYTVQKTDNPFSDLIDGLAKYKAARDEQSKTNALTDIENFAKLEDAANKAQSATLEAAAGALQGIGSVISETVNTLDSLGSLSEEDKKTADQIINMINGATTLAKGIATGDVISIITGSVQLLTNAYQLFDVESQKIAERIAQDQKAIESLQLAYEKLERSITKAYGSEKKSLLLEEKANLEKEIKLKKDLIQAEWDKRNKREAALDVPLVGIIGYLASPDADEAKIKQLENDLKELGYKAEDINDKVTEALTGSSVSSAIDEFANAYADAFTSGEDAANKSINVVSNLFRTALVEKLKNNLKPGVTDLMTMVSDAMADGILTADEKATIELKRKELDAKSQADQQAFTDLGLNNTSQAKGIQGDVKNMTEDTGSALVGQIIAMRINVAEIVTGYKNSAEIMTKQLAIQQQIADNTAYCRKLERMDNTLEYIRINGIKMI